MMMAPLNYRTYSDAQMRANDLVAASKAFADAMDAWSGWFMVAVVAGRENKVCEAMKDARIDAWVPMVTAEYLAKVHRRGGKRRYKAGHLCNIQERTELAFEGYMAVRIVPSVQAWRAVNSFDNVLGMLMGITDEWAIRYPAKWLRYALSPRELDSLNEMRKLENADAVENFLPGEKVRVNEGPWQGLQGFVMERASRPGLVWAEIECFGRATPMEFFLDELERVDL